MVIIYLNGADLPIDNMTDSIEIENYIENWCATNWVKAESVSVCPTHLQDHIKFGPKLTADNWREIDSG